MNLLVKEQYSVLLVLKKETKTYVTLVYVYHYNELRLSTPKYTFYWYTCKPNSLVSRGPYAPSLVIKVEQQPQWN